MEDWQKEMKRSTESTLELMLESLGLTLEDVKWLRLKMGCNEAQALLQLNSYPVCTEPDLAIGLGQRTDSSLLTVVHQSNSRGLQVRRDGIGMPVHPIDGALVVNVGDIMQILTNGRFKSNVHLAVVNKTRHRISVAYFYGLPSEVKISLLISLADDDHPRLYCPVTWKEYLHIKSMHFKNPLELIKHGKGE